MAKSKIKYGWLPDVPDKRDLLFSKIRRMKNVDSLPRVVDLRAGFSEVEDQGSLGSCTAQALAGNVEYLDVADGGEYNDISRLFIYYNERVLMNTVEYDSGAYLRDGIKTLAKQGYCKEQLWPYQIEKFRTKPPAECYKQAETIDRYSRLTSLDDMLNCLARGIPFVFGFSVYESFEGPDVARTGIMKMPKRGERMNGGHAVCAAGYDMDKKILIVRNSWGKKWGQEGYFMMPFAYVEDGDLSADFWAVEKR